MIIKIIKIGNNKQNEIKGKTFLQNQDKGNKDSRFCPVCEKFVVHLESECRNKWKLQKAEKGGEKNIGRSFLHLLPLSR